MPRILLVTGVFLAPVIFDRGAASPFNFPKITALWVFGVAASGLWLMEVLQGRTRAVSFRLGVIGGLFLLAFAAATAFSETPIVSFFGWHERTSGLLEYGLYVAIFFLIAQLYWRRPERLKELIYALGAASAVVAAYVIVQWMNVDPFSWGSRPGSPIYKRIGTIGNPNFVGGFLGATSPWLVYAFWRARGLRWRVVVVVWAAVTLWALLLTESRGGLVAMVLAAAVAALAFRLRFPRWLFVSAAVAAVLLSIVAAVVLLRPSGARPEVAVPGTRDVLRTETLEIRSFWWKASLRIFADHPIVGTGPETFVLVFPRYMDPEGAGKVERGPGVEASDSPHNVFLAHASQTGSLGVGTFTALIAVAMIWGFRRMRVADRPQADLLGAFLAIVAGYSGQAFFSIDIPAIAMIVWVALGGVAALADPRLVALREQPPQVAPPRRMTRVRWVAVGVVALLTASVVVEGLRPWRAERATAAAREASRSDDFATAKRIRAEAVALYPVDPMYSYAAGSQLLNRSGDVTGPKRAELLREAITYFKRTDQLQPHFHIAKLSLGETYSRLAVAGDRSAFYDSSVAFQEASELAPNDWRVLTRYADMLNRWGAAEGRPQRYCVALKKLRRALRLRTGDPKTWRSLAVTYTHLGDFDRALAAVQQSLIIDSDDPESFQLRQLILATRARGDTPVVNC